jgi:hypothetical protein
MKQEIEPKAIRKGDSIRQEWLDTDGKPRASEWVIDVDDAYLSDHGIYTYYLLNRPVTPIPSLPVTINSVVLLSNDSGDMSRGWVLIAPNSWQILHRLAGPCSTATLMSYVATTNAYRNGAVSKYVIHDAKDSK